MSDIDPPSKWNSNLSRYVFEDEVEVKPRVQKLPPAKSVNDPSHYTHDFSIHLHKRYEYTLPIPSVVQEGTQNSCSERTQKCEDCFVAQTCCDVKKWTKIDVSEVIATEQRFFRDFTLVIKFPDKKVNKQVVAKHCKSFRAINFINPPYARRCCFVLKDPQDRAQILTKLNSTRFGSGYLSADNNFEELVPSEDDIDPFTLYVDIAPFDLSHEKILLTFPTSQQIIICYKVKMYYKKRFAFVVYPTIKIALTAFKDINKNSDLLVRFRRFSGGATLPSEYEIKRIQGNGAHFQQGSPLLTDPGPPGVPVTFSEGNSKIVRRAVKAEVNINKQTAEGHADYHDSNDSGTSSNVMDNYYSTTGFEQQLESYSASCEFLRNNQDREQSNT